MTRPRLQFRLRGALLAGTLVPLLLVAVVSLVATAALTSSLADAEGAIRSEQVLFTADLVTRDVIDAETGMRGFVITGQEPFLDPYTRGTSDFTRDVAALRALVASQPDEVAAIADIEATFATWNRDVAIPVIEAVRSGTVTAAAEIVISGNGKAQIDRIRAAMDAVTAAERAQATARLAQTQSTTTLARRISFYGTVLAVVLGIAIAVLFARRLATRVRRVAGAAATLAAGDLSARAPVSGHDEVADLATTFNAMATRLEEASATERRTAEELRRRTAETEVANRELEAFSYSVSHDLRAPLRSIDGFSQALVEDYADALEPAAREYLTRVRAASQRMAALIDDLLRLSRISRDALRAEPIDMSALSAGVVADLQATEPQRTVTVDIEPGMHAFGDARLVRIALENLIGNAWKFSGERADATISVRSESGPDGPEFVVEDNGAGFDTRFATNLFGPFQRMHPMERFPGTGIGLATVQRIVHRHGGTIRAESEVGRGACFRFTLSQPKGAVAGDPPQPAPADSTGTGGRARGAEVRAGASPGAARPDASSATGSMSAVSGAAPERNSS